MKDLAIYRDARSYSLKVLPMCYQKPENISRLMARYEENARPDSEIDTSDIPALTDEQLVLSKPVKNLKSIKLSHAIILS